MPSRVSKDPTTEPLDRILVASRALVSIAARSLADLESDITLAQYRALVLLCQHGRLNVGALAEALAVKPPTATGLCDRLENKGLVDRSTSPESRREVTLRPTPAGRAVVKAVTARRRRELARIVARFDRDEARAVAAAFEAFAAAAAELPDEAWKLGWT